MDVPVEEFREGDRVTLLNGRLVVVNKISRYAEDDSVVVGWYSGPTFGPGHKLAGQRQQIGQFASRRPGETLAVGGRIGVAS